MLLKKAHKKSDKNKLIEMTVQGSKHSFSRVFPSFLQLPGGVLQNVPDIKDVEIQIDILKKLGFGLDFDKKSNLLKYSGFRNQNSNRIDIGDYSSQYSRSLINLFPIFSRFDLELKEPIGCPIGRRDISWYVDIMKQFGINVDLQNTRTRVHRSKLKKVSNLKIRDRSFSSTNIAIACAIEAKSDTKIFGISLEPEIFDLIKMLKSAEVNINYNEENDCLNIQAGKFNQAKSVNHTLLPDRNVIVTHVCGALLLKKNIVINTLYFTEAQLKLAPFTDILRQLNIEYEFLDDRMIVKGLFCKLKGKYLEIKAGHYPLFCSDWQPLIAVLSLLGLNMTIEDTLFESRFGYLEEYKKFDVKSRKINERRAELLDSEGFQTNHYKIIKANALDLRCGAGLGLLSMLHEDGCEIHNDIQIKRGYEHFDKQLNSLINNDLFSYQG